MARAVVVAMLSVLLAAACGRSREGQQPRGKPDSAGTAASDRYEPLGARVAPNDPLLAAMRPSLEEWTRLWAQALPGFTLDSLYRTAPERLRFAYSRKIGLEMNDLARARFFGAISPDTTRIAEPSIYWIVEDGVPNFEAEPDAASALLDLRSDSLHVLATFGTLGRFDETFWIDRDRFVVVGRAERRVEPALHGGDLWVYDLRNRTLTRYHTPDMDAETYRRFGRLVEQYLKRRYRMPAAA